VHACICNSAEPSLQWKLCIHTLRKKCTCTRACVHMQQCRTFFAMEATNLSRVLREHRAGCSLPPALLLSRRHQSPDAVRSRNPSKSTLAHDAVAAAVSHTHHSIIRVGAGLIQFVHGSHSKRGHGAHPSKKSIFAIFRASSCLNTVPLIASFTAAFMNAARESALALFL